MEATTMQTARYEAIGFGGAFAHQFRFLWTSRRPLLLAVAMLALLVLAGEPWTQDPMMRLLKLWPVWLALVGPVWAFAVFHNEGPSSRFYFWAQPVGRATNTLARIAAGVAWLWITIAALIVAGWLFGVADGDAWQMAEIDLAGWVNFFTGPLLGYLAISILTIPSDYPIRWFLGLLFLFPLAISGLTEWLEMEDLVETVLQPLGNESWGLGVTMIGGLAKSVERLEDTLRVMQDPTFTGGTPFDAAQMWWTATPLWILGFVVIVTLIATRHPDTLPKWRGFRR